MSVYFSPLLPAVIPKLGAWLRARPELAGAELAVSDRWLPRAYSVRVMLGAGSGRVDLLDLPALRVGIRVSDAVDDQVAAAEQLTALVRAYFDGPAADGDPVTWSRVTAGPVPVDEAPTGVLEHYLVVDLRRRAAELT